MSGQAGVLALGFGLGLAGGLACWRMLAPVFDAPLFARTNVRGAQVPVAVGVVIPVVVVASAAVLVVLDASGVLDVDRAALALGVAAATGFGLLGLLDDVAGDPSSRGFAGHLRALRSARLTTGAVKLFGGGAVAVLVASTTSTGHVARLLADAALIALSANLANLLDRAPGRVAKAGLVAALPIVAVAGADGRLLGPAIVVGAVVALIGDDLGERLMLGDTGANVIGGVLGLAVVLTTAPATRTVVLGIVAALNVASEVVSFSRVIDATPPLRWFDRLGRRPM